MKKVIITISIALLSLSAMAADRRVAVLQPAGNVSNDIKEIVRELISSAIVNAAGYTVLERQLLDDVLKEQRIQIGGLITDNEILKIGELSGANYVFVTSVTPLDRNYFISVKLVDAQTAKIEKQSTDQTQSGTSDLIGVVQTLASGIVGAIGSIGRFKFIIVGNRLSL